MRKINIIVYISLYWGLIRKSSDISASDFYLIYLRISFRISFTKQKEIFPPNLSYTILSFPTFPHWQLPMRHMYSPYSNLYIVINTGWWSPAGPHTPGPPYNHGPLGCETLPLSLPRGYPDRGYGDV